MVSQAITGPATLLLEPNWDIHVYSQDLPHSSLTHLCKFLFKYKLSQLYCYEVLFLSLKMPATSKFPKDFSLCLQEAAVYDLSLYWVYSITLCSVLFAILRGWKKFCNTFWLKKCLCNWGLSYKQIPCPKKARNSKPLYLLCLSPNHWLKYLGCPPLPCYAQ